MTAKARSCWVWENKQKEEGEGKPQSLNGHVTREVPFFELTCHFQLVMECALHDTMTLNDVRN